jgi:hypothetical protein
VPDQLIAFVNHSTVPEVAAELPAAIQALQQQVTYDFEPHWNAGATLLLVDDTPSGKAGELNAKQVVSTLPPGAWLMTILDDTSQAGILGYHTLDTKKRPIGFVFAKTDVEAGLSWTVTASHELLEMLGDPYANLAVQIKQDGTALAYETADAVEDDSFGYTIGSTLVSDFVLPSWFIARSPGPWDFKGHCTGPLQLLKGGYIGVWVPGKGWTQATADKVRHAPVLGGRFSLRQEGRAWPDQADVPSWVGSGEAEAALA